MNEQKIEHTIKKVVDQAPGLDFKALADRPYVKMPEHDDITRQTPKPSAFRHAVRALSIAACFVVFLSLFNWLYFYRTPDSVISLDVNPGVEITVNRRDLVLSVRALNEDAAALIEGTDYHYADLTLTLESLLTKMADRAYLQDENNAIMIAIENDDPEKAETLAEKLNTMTEGFLDKTQTPAHMVIGVLGEDKDGRESEADL
jgi:hypothetical protein